MRCIVTIAEGAKEAGVSVDDCNSLSEANLFAFNLNTVAACDTCLCVGLAHLKGKGSFTFPCLLQGLDTNIAENDPKVKDDRCPGPRLSRIF